MTDYAPPCGWFPDPSGAPGQRYFDGKQWTHYGPPPPPQPSIVINNTVGTPAPVVVSTGPNHALHLVLTLLTCGMWLPIWVIVALVGHRRVYVGGQRRSKTGLIVAGVFGGLVLLGLVITYWPVFVGLGVVAGLGYLGYRTYERAVERKTEQGRIGSRADAQNQAFMSGDPSGTYGQYPPA